MVSASCASTETGWGDLDRWRGCANNLPMGQPEQTKPIIKVANKATLYLPDLCGFDRIEANDLAWYLAPYAQYRNAVHVSYVIRGKRKRKKYVFPKGDFVMLDGWEHPDPPDRYGEPKKGKGYTVLATRRFGGDPEWQHEFRAFLKGYLAGSGAKVLWDSKHHKPEPK